MITQRLMASGGSDSMNIEYYNPPYYPYEQVCMVKRDPANSSSYTARYTVNNANLVSVTARWDGCIITANENAIVACSALRFADSTSTTGLMGTVGLYLYNGDAYSNTRLTSYAQIATQRSERDFPIPALFFTLNSGESNLLTCGGATGVLSIYLYICRLS